MKRPNKAEKAWMNAIAQLPCCVNNQDCCLGLELHHIMDHGRRIGHLHTIPLCFNHHQAQTPLPYGEAVHKGIKTFEAKYGTQMEMLERTKQAVGILNT